MTDKTDKSDLRSSTGPSWTGAAAMAGAAIGSAALAAALLYASRRKEPSERKAKTPPADVPETD